MNQARLKNPAKPSNAFFNILFNVIIPAVILSKASGADRLGPVWGLIVALAFPISFGAMELIKEKKWNFFSILGLVSVLLTGGLALLKLEGIWFAVKEATIPAVIGIGVFATAKSKYNVVRLMVYKPSVVEVEKIQEKLREANSEELFDGVILKTTYLFVLSFFASSVLNFILAIVILKSPAGTEAFNQELGKMTALSFPVIMVPSMILSVLGLYYLINGVKKLTGLTLDDIIKSPETNQTNLEK